MSNKRAPRRSMEEWLNTKMVLFFNGVLISNICVYSLSIIVTLTLSDSLDVMHLVLQQLKS